MRKLTLCLFIATMLLCSWSALAGGVPPVAVGDKLTDADWARIVDARRHQVQTLDIFFLDAAKYAVGDWSQVDYQFSVAVHEGSFDLPPTEFAVKSYVAVSYFNGGNNPNNTSTLFQGVTPFKVVAGQMCQVIIRAKLLPDCHYEILISDLPYEFDSNSTQVTLSINGQQYFGYARFNSNGQLVANFWAPYDLNGAGDVIIFDANHSVACTMNFNLYGAIIGSYTVPFQPSPNFGTIDALVDYVHENKFVKVGTMFYATIQDAINANLAGYPIDIQIGEGSYANFTVPAGVSVTVNGLGADQSIIYGQVWSSVFGDPVYHDDGRGKSVADAAATPEVTNASAPIAKGGGFYLKLSNLQVHVGTGYPHDWYSDAAVVMEGGALSISNCVIRSDSNACVTTNYDQGVTIDHSVLYGSYNNGLQCSYASGSIIVTNSIMMHSLTILAGTYATVDLRDSILWDYKSLVSNLNYVKLVMTNVLSVDPLIDVNTWYCDPNGPAGSNIGIMRRG